MVYLYKFRKDGTLQLVDMGVRSRDAEYVRRGYVVSYVPIHIEEEAYSHRMMRRRCYHG